jgi:hypothetical protein
MRRARASVFVLGCFASATTLGCGAAGPHERSTGASPSACDPSHLDVCERALAAHLLDGDVSRESVAAYVEAREAKASGDAWAALYRGVVAAQKPFVLIAEARGTEANAAAKSDAAVLTTPALPAPTGIDKASLLAAIATAAGGRTLALVTASDDTTLEIYGDDPIVFSFAGITPAVHTKLADVARDASLDGAIRKAFVAAKAGDYVTASGAVDALAALLDKAPEFDEPVLRARYARAILSAGGIELEAKTSSDEEQVTPVAPPPASTDSPYGDFLRVRLAKDERAEWARRSAKILPAIAEDRRALIETFQAMRSGCGAALKAPPIEGPRDLMFGPMLVASLAPAEVSEADATAHGMLTLSEWLKRYDALVRQIDRAKLGFYYAPTLVFQRGELRGLSAAGTATYRRVTEIVTQHIAASKRLEEAEPSRYRPLALLSFALSPGALSDDAIRDATSKLSQASIQDKLARASDAKSTAETLFTGVVSGIELPPALRDAQYVALQGAFAAKLRGTLHAQTGWGTAGLYAVDAIARLAMDLGPNLPWTAQEIARSLGDPSVPQPALAALSTAVARYVALAADKKLALGEKTDHFPPDRAAARAALRSAIAGLGAAGEAPNNVLDDVTDLSDGLISALSVAMRAQPPPPAKGVCVPGGRHLTPDVRRALAKLGDVRKRILGHPRYKSGDGLWVRRTRLLVTLLSDAMDFSLAEGGKSPSFAIDSKTAERAIDDALREWEEHAAAGAVTGLYALVRTIGASGSSQDAFKAAAPNLRRVLAGLAVFFRSDPNGAASASSTMLATLARFAPADGGGDLGATLLSFSRGFYAQKKPDQGDLFLLGAMLQAVASETLPSKELIDLSREQKSRIAWALPYFVEAGKARRGAPPNPAEYADGMRKASDDACLAGSAEASIATMLAIRDYRLGKRKEAREALEKQLQKADDEGLVVPKMVYKYEERTATKVFALTLGLSYGSPLTRTNTFQLGVGMRSRGEAGGELSTKIESPDTSTAMEDAARFYVYASALAAAYNFLDGDDEHATAAARRALNAIAFGAKLGKRVAMPSKPGAFATDARALLAVVGQLAADRGMPFLAGDLFQVVKTAYGPDTDDKTVEEALATTPFGLGDAPEVAPLLARSRKSLEILLEPLACTTKKVELGGFEAPTCEKYPLALAYRIADSLPKLPRLKRGSDQGGTCAALRAVDDFVATAAGGTYDPDKFTRAVDGMHAAGKSYDAAILLARQRRDGHCSAALTATGRALADLPSLGPALRSDVLSGVLGCSSAALDARTVDDVLLLDESTKKLPDPTRNMTVMLWATDVSMRSARPDLLARLASKPDFVDRWVGVHPTAATFALVLRDAAYALRGDPPVAGDHASQLLCETLPPGDRAGLCALSKGLRASGKSDDERKALAKQAIETVLAQAGKGLGK